MAVIVPQRPVKMTNASDAAGELYRFQIFK